MNGKSYTTLSILTPYLRLVRLRLLFSFVLPSHSFDSKLLTTLLAASTACLWIPIVVDFTC